MDRLDDLTSGKIFIGGPCTIEDRDQVFRLAEKVKSTGADFFRAGAFKPRTSPHSFQGLGEEGVRILSELKKVFDIPVVSEIVDPRHIDMFEDIDVLQVGARNMQNFQLLKELGKTDKYILLKRGMGSTVDELISASEYITSQGNKKVILCERGIRTFETTTRYTLDISSISEVKKRTDLKIIVDPSHAMGRASFVRSAALAGVAAGADGLIIEVHDRPEEALVDKDQAISPGEFERIIREAKQIINIIE